MIPRMTRISQEASYYVDSGETPSCLSFGTACRQVDRWSGAHACKKLLSGEMPNQDCCVWGCGVIEFLSVGSSCLSGLDLDMMDYYGLVCPKIIGLARAGLESESSLAN